MKENILFVYLHENFIGTLRYVHGRFQFQYEKEWLKNANKQILSLSLPFREEAFEDKEARPFFVNLLPEAQVREQIAHYWHIPEKNDFKLLDVLAGECAGAVTLIAGKKEISKIAGYVALSDKETKNLLLRQQKTNFFLNVKYFLDKKKVRLSLAGAQYKLPVYIKNKKLYLPTVAAPSSHIIKPENILFKGSVINEYFCMRLAKEIGLSVPNVSLYYLEQENLYVIERYDRAIKNKKLIRLHQEDFCQALGVLPENKYQAHGGPNLQQCFELVSKYSIKPAVDRKRLLEWVVFNYFIGNADAHAKNLSLLFLEQGPKLAPFYDLFSTEIYEDLTYKIAMKIGGEDRYQYLQMRHWERFAEEANIKQSFLFKLINDFSERILDVAENLVKEIHEEKLDLVIPEKICMLIKKRKLKISNMFKK